MAPLPARMNPHPAPPPHVAIVDDEDAVRRGLGNLLKSAGYATSSFESGEAFLASGLPADVDCLVLDIRLADSDGFALQAALLRSGIEVPVIFISGHADRRTELLAMRSGAVGLLHKPIEIEIMLACIEQAIFKYRGAG